MTDRSPTEALNDQSFVVVGETLGTTFNGQTFSDDDDEKMIDRLTTRIEEMNDAIKLSLTSSSGSSLNRGDDVEHRNNSGATECKESGRQTIGHQSRLSPHQTSETVSDQETRRNRVENSRYEIGSNRVFGENPAPAQNSISLHEDTERTLFKRLNSEEEKVRSLRREKESLVKKNHETEQALAVLEEENKKLDELVKTEDTGKKFAQVKDAFMKIKQLKHELLEKENIDKEYREIMQEQQIEHFDRMKEKDAEIDELRKQLKSIESLHSEINRLEKDNEDLRKNAEKYEEKMKRKEEEIGDLKEQLRSFDSKVSIHSESESTVTSMTMKRIERDLQKSRTDAKELEDKCLDLEEELSDLKSENERTLKKLRKDHKREMDTLKDKVEDKESELQEAQEKAKQVSEMKKQERQYKSEIRNLKSQVTELEERCRKCEDEGWSITSQGSGCMEQTLLKDQLAEKEEEMKRMHEKYENRINDLKLQRPSNNDEELTNLQKKYDTLLEKNRNLESKIKELENTINELKNNQNDADEIEKLYAEIDALKEEKARSINDRKKLEKTVNDMNDKKKQLMGDNRALKSEKAQLEIKIRTLEKTSNDNTSAMEECEELRMKMSAVEEANSRERKLKEQEVSSLKKRIDELMREAKQKKNITDEKSKLEADLQGILYRMNNVRATMYEKTNGEEDKRDILGNNEKDILMRDIEMEIQNILTDRDCVKQYNEILRKELRYREYRHKEFESEKKEEQNRILVEDFQKKQRKAEEGLRSANNRCTALERVIMALQERLEMITSPSFTGRIQPYPIYNGSSHFVGDSMPLM